MGGDDMLRAKELPVGKLRRTLADEGVEFRTTADLEPLRGGEQCSRQGLHEHDGLSGRGVPAGGCRRPWPGPPAASHGPRVLGARERVKAFHAARSPDAVVEGAAGRRYNRPSA
jgi:hypothetical protein